MIDIDKYEGHTEGPWHFCLGYDIKSDTYTGINPLKGGGDRVNGPVILSEYQFAKGSIGHRADKVLIEDAPLLLEEVKRLRELAKICLEAIEAGGDIRSGTIEVIEANLKGMIE